MSLPTYKVREYWDRYVFNVGLDGVRHLTDCYCTFSDTKKQIFQDISKICADKNGFKLSIITHNQKYFTVGFMFKNNDKLFFQVFIPSGSGVLEIGPNEKCDAMQHRLLP